MKDERTLADHSGDANEMVLCPTCGALPCDQTQALRSQPSVEEVARVSEGDIAILKRVIGIEYYAGSDEFGDALKRILAALYKGEGG